MSTGRAYYNEVDLHAADWLRNLIAAKLITAGEVDTRSIVDVRPGDLAGFTRCHFFAGIGVWDYALGLAGWPAVRPVWTGSCPCQPFSAAGGRGGFADERHLWPAFFHLIRECRPATVLGEQVASKDGLGWLDLVQADLEGEGYAVGAADLCAPGEGVDGGGCPDDEWLQRAILNCPDPVLADELRAYADWARGSISLGAPNIRQRLWFVADAHGGNASTERQQRGREHGQQPEDGVARIVADADSDGWQGAEPARSANRGRRPSDEGGPARIMGDAAIEQHAQHQPRRLRSEEATDATRLRGCDRASSAGAVSDFWSGAEWLPCRDGKARPVESGSFPLVDGAAFRLGSGSPYEGRSRAGMLKGYGNAINAQRARGFIEAVMECRP